MTVLPSLSNTPPKHVVMVAHGTSGDISPLVGVAERLIERGDSVTFLANAYFAERVTSVGAKHVSIGTREEQARLLENPKIYAGTSAPKAYFEQMALPSIPRIVEALRGLFEKVRPNLVMHHILAFGAEAVARDRGIPTAVAVYSPVAWNSNADPGVLPHLPWFRMPKILAPMVGTVTEALARYMFDGPINKKYRELGLPDQKDILNLEFRGGNVNLGMWSRHFRDRMPDDPVRSHITGFVNFDRQVKGEQLDPAITRFLDDGHAPIIFTLGTGVIHQPKRDFYSIAAEACKLAGVRGLLLIGNESNTPARHLIDDNIMTALYAPFRQVLQRGAMTVHHGGLSTTAEALRAGNPSIVVPSAYDQHDNADRVKRLGVGTSISWKRLTPERLAQHIEYLLEPGSDALRNAEELGTRLRAEDGPGNAANYALLTST